MCGIAGQVALSPHVSASLDQVAAMTSALVHRGPDDDGFLLDPRHRAALGMRRLSIIDLNTGSQPIFDESGSIACVFNGEIYNFQALRADLEQRGHRFKTLTDTEAIVHLYEEEGVGCVRRLRGMFAFAIWDARTDTLLLARDRVGKKPLYFTSLDGCFSFASELNALLALPTLPRRVDPVGLDLFLTHSYIPAPETIYQGIRKLPPAHVAVVRGGQVDLQRYWRIDLDAPFWEGPRTELLEVLREKLREAVKVRMVADVPIGCFLSGGVDSSAVASLMASLSPEPIETFSIGFPHDDFNELDYARIVARHLGTRHHERVVRPDAVALLPKLIRHFGEPFGDSSALPTWHVASLAREHVTVALSGDGGDELFAGYPRHLTGLSLDRLAGRVPPWISRLVAAAPGPARVRRLARRLAAPPAQRYASLSLLLDGDAKRALYAPAFRNALADRRDGYLANVYESAHPDPLTAMLQTDFLTYLPEDILVKVDRMTMANSLEGRAPLLDQELVEFVLRIPPTFKVDATGTKAILRAAVAPLLPPRFLDRPKMGFSVPLASWLRNELRDHVYAKIGGGGALVGQPWIESAVARRMLDEHVRGRRDWSAQLWNLLVLAEWAEAYSPQPF